MGLKSWISTLPYTSTSKFHQNFSWTNRITTPLKTKMTGWKIPMFNRECMFIHGGFSIVMFVFGRSISYFILGKEAAVFFSTAGPRSPGRWGEARWSSKVFTTVMLWYDFIAWTNEWKWIRKCSFFKWKGCTNDSWYLMMTFTFSYNAASEMTWE